VARGLLCNASGSDDGARKLLKKSVIKGLLTGTELVSIGLQPYRARSVAGCCLKRMFLDGCCSCVCYPIC